MEHITEKHRLFYVNDKLEFALFPDPKITDKEKILENFLESKLWKFYKFTYEVTKVKNIEVSEDLMMVRIMV